MKFTHQLKFNSVPEWREHYIQYAHLKKYIYALAKKEADHQADGAGTGDVEGLIAPLLQDGGRASGPTEEGFQRELDSQLAALLGFFAVKEADLLAKVSELELEVQSMEKIPNRNEASNLVRARGGGSAASGTPSPGASPRASAAGAALSALSGLLAASPSTMDLARMVAASPPEDHRSVRVAFWKNPPRHLFSSSLQSRAAKLQSRFQDLYIALHDLREFLHINKEGFRKIIKKHDKLTRSVDLRARWWPNVEAHLAPAAKQAELDGAIAGLTDTYAVVYCRGDASSAEELLSRGLREHITVERNTVWRDMAALERKYAAVSVKQAAGAAKPSWLWRHARWLKLGFALAVFGIMLQYEVWPGPENAPRNGCLALLVFASLLWSLEAVPLFVTSMLLPLLIVLLGVLVDRTKDPPQRMTPQQAAPAIFHAMFSQTIMLLLGGFAIAAALSKHAIAKQFAVAILSRVGRRPRNVLLASMFTATFASMWISNVAAPVLCFGLIQPILRTLDPGHPFAKALVMGIALASNVGGMTSPISSPQNIFAIERMSLDGRPPSWLAWFAVALPVSIACNFVCWGLLLAVYRPERVIAEVRPIKPNTDPINGTQVYICAVSLLTVGAWCANTFLQKFTGEMGVVAVVPLVAFFGFDVLNKDDFNSFLWNVVMLAMGGLCLGEAVKSSGLLAALALGISDLVTGLSLWQVAVVFCGMVLVATTFISHTVGAMVILPIVQSVGEAMPGTPHPKLLVMAAALMCSGAMGLPVSGFPNMNAVSLEDATGNAIVATQDFLLSGVPGSIAAYGIIVTLGHHTMALLAAPARRLAAGPTAVRPAARRRAVVAAARAKTPDSPETAARGLRDTTYGQVSSSLLKTANKLTALGVAANLKVPTLVIAGDQSSGKSSVVEAIAGVALPRSDGTCTRCPTEVRLRTDGPSSGQPWMCRIKLHRQFDAPGNRLAEMPPDEVFAEICDPSHISVFVSAAQAVLLSPTAVEKAAGGALDYAPSVAGPGSPQAPKALDDLGPATGYELSFTANKVVLEVLGADVDLTLVDLPGIIHNHPKGDTYVHQVKAMTKAQLQPEHHIVAMALPAGLDPETQAIRLWVREADPEGARSVGIFTKPDTLPADAHIAIANLVKTVSGTGGATTALALGYYVVRNPSQEQLLGGCTHDQARASERDYFAAAPHWAQAVAQQPGLQERLGAEALRSGLSALMVEALQRELPEMWGAAQGQLDKQDAGRAGGAAAPAQRRPGPGAALAAVAGGRHAARPRHRQPRRRQPRALPGPPGNVRGLGRAAVRATPAFLVGTTLVCALGAEDKGVKLEAGAREGLGVLDLGTWEDGKLKTSAEAEAALKSDEKLRAYLAEHQFPAEPMMLAQVQAVLRDHAGRELPTFSPYSAVEELVRSFKGRWREHAEACLARAVQLAGAEVDAVLQAEFGAYPKALRAVRAAASAHLAALQAEARQALRELVGLEECGVFTLNALYFRTQLAAFEARLKQAHLQRKALSLEAETKVKALLDSLRGHGNAFGGPQDLLMAQPTPVDDELHAMAACLAYFKVSFKRLQDGVPLLVGGRLLQRLGSRQGLEAALRRQLGPDGCLPRHPPCASLPAAQAPLAWSAPSSLLPAFSEPVILVVAAPVAGLGAVALQAFRVDLSCHGPEQCRISGAAPLLRALGLTTGDSVALGWAPGGSGGPVLAAAAPRQDSTAAAASAIAAGPPSTAASDGAAGTEQLLGTLKVAAGGKKLYGSALAKLAFPGPVWEAKADINRRGKRYGYAAVHLLVPPMGPRGVLPGYDLAHMYDTQDNYAELGCATELTWAFRAVDGQQLELWRRGDGRLELRFTPAAPMKLPRARPAAVRLKRTPPRASVPLVPPHRPAARESLLGTDAARVEAAVRRSGWKRAVKLGDHVVWLRRRSTTVLLSAATALARDMGLQPGEEVQLWRRRDGWVEARRVAAPARAATKASPPPQAPAGGGAASVCTRGTLAGKGAAEARRQGPELKPMAAAPSPLPPPSQTLPPPPPPLPPPPPPLSLRPPPAATPLRADVPERPQAAAVPFVPPTAAKPPVAGGPAAGAVGGTGSSPGAALRPAAEENGASGSTAEERVVMWRDLRRGLRVVAGGPHPREELRALGVGEVIDFRSSPEEGDWAAVWWRRGSGDVTELCWVGRVGGTQPPVLRYELVLAPGGGGGGGEGV
ncbi:hypothetical protein HYH03_015147 [Edaphochlamys debaryana]|uniref:SPX domain-containing protein n=1 Tax=Edaphochlamys debaryana TaxID=47281 RepID=A0A835XUL2_9CHLO|nr:hypothetical protein HYH03_015147 [Edaphochlamys debaryana]|eukprot:KAG2486184.1 hypothetical protein HYH03_015147 [Edaphochlamys debaryana]